MGSGLGALHGRTVGPLCGMNFENKAGKKRGTIKPNTKYFKKGLYDLQ